MHGQQQVPLRIEGPTSSASKPKVAAPPAPRLPFATAAELLDITRRENMTIAQVVFENERATRTDREIIDALANLYRVMDNSIYEGVTSTEEYLPGDLKVKRRARGLHKKLMRGLYPGIPESEWAKSSLPEAGHIPQRTREPDAFAKPHIHGRFDHPIQPISLVRTVFPQLDTLSCFAIAVNESNAAGKRVVTAPTNGASGVLPSVAKYIVDFMSSQPERDICTFLLTASAVGMLIKRGATISAAEGGCMAEVGSASAMAAAGFAATQGGSPEQCLSAAEIALEHSLGSTCDPLGGLVQIPCIERNAIGSVKAVTAAQLALSSVASGYISLDECILAMRQTAKDMSSSYKETSRAGLATNARISVRHADC